MEATSLVPYDPASGRPGTRLEATTLSLGVPAAIPGSGGGCWRRATRSARTLDGVGRRPPELTTEAVGRLPAGPQP